MSNEALRKAVDVMLLDPEVVAAAVSAEREQRIRADERAKCIAEIEALLDGFGENEITDGYEHGFNEGLARALDALREKED